VSDKELLEQEKRGLQEEMDNLRVQTEEEVKT